MLTGHWSAVRKILSFGMTGLTGRVGLWPVSEKGRGLGKGKMRSAIEYGVFACSRIMAEFKKTKLLRKQRRKPLFERSERGLCSGLPERST